MTGAPSGSDADCSEPEASGASASPFADTLHPHSPGPAETAPLRDDASTIELAVGEDLGLMEEPSNTEPEPGTVLGCRYRLEQVIGHGGTSTVYSATDLRLAPSVDTTANLVALKLSRGKPCTEPPALDRLEREFQTMSRLSHPAIARVFELDRDDDLRFMTMQLIEGQTLRTWMTKCEPHSKAVKIIDACCDALEYAHSMGIVHGDLKPTNVLVTDDCTAILIDFGASSLPMDPHAEPGSAPVVATTPLYASPQILAGHRPEPLDDVFSLACLSYSILSGGRHPYGGRPSFEGFRAKSAPTYVRSIPVELFEVIERGLSAERDRRPASVSEFRREFTEAEQRRRVKACLSHPVAAPIIQKRAPKPPVWAQAMAKTARAAMPVKAALASGLKRASPLLLPASALLAALVSAAVLFSDTGATYKKRVDVERLAERIQPAQAAPVAALQFTTSQSLPAPDQAAALAGKAVTLPHDSSSISFKAALIHTSARQSLVAITVTRAPANRTPGPFVWRIERGTAMPAIDYQRIKPRRVKFIEGQTARTLFIPLLNKSSSKAKTRPRFFDVVLQPVAGGPALGRFSRITVVIDPMPAVWLANSSAASHSLR